MNDIYLNLRTKCQANILLVYLTGNVNEGEVDIRGMDSGLHR